jgi:MarR family transcriptional regulator, lower aerobic nicotinate degradation pathway regulator
MGKVARRADDELLAPLSVAERELFMGLLIRISGTEG